MAELSIGILVNPNLCAADHASYDASDDVSDDASDDATDVP